VEVTVVEFRSRENIRANGEVFTPFPIVDKMLALIPDAAWNDPEYCFLEPACGNGQFLVRIFEKRIAAGMSIEVALNTMIGMDISQENILDSHFRLYERACYQMTVEGVQPQSREWFSRAVRIVAIVTTNIFKVSDSLDYIKSGKLEQKKFFFDDPTGSGQTLAFGTQVQMLDRIDQQFKKYEAKPSGDATGNSFTPFMRKS
jgi:hypothetical protein